MRGLAAGGGDDREQRARRGGDRRDAQGDHVGDGRRDLVATVAPGGEQLLDEERVPARALVQIVDERRGHGLAGDCLELAGDIFAAERLEVEPRDERAAGELRHEPPGRMLERELAGAVRQRERDPLVAQVAGEERHEVARRRVGPVHVLEHDEQRPARRRAAEQVEHQLVQPALPEPIREARPAAFEAGEQHGERAAGVVVEVVELLPERQRPQRRDHGRVRELLAAELEALAVQDEEAQLAPARLERADEAGLADPRLAGDQGELRSALQHGVEHAAERLQRRVAADDRPARHLAAGLHKCE